MSFRSALIAAARLSGFRLVCISFVISGCVPQDKPVTDPGSDGPPLCHTLQNGTASTELSRMSHAAASAKSDVVTTQADNSECLICHMDFKNELLSARHEKAGIGCTSCHGPSLAHGDDELNITPPDKLYGRAEIVPFCKACHRPHVEGRVYDEFVKKWHSRRRPNGRMILDDSVCTDCHGKHAILRVDQQQEINSPR